MKIISREEQFRKADRVKELRIEMGLTQKGLKKLFADKYKFSQGYYSKMESGIMSFPEGFCTDVDTLFIFWVGEKVKEMEANIKRLSKLATHAIQVNEILAAQKIRHENK